MVEEEELAAAAVAKYKVDLGNLMAYDPLHHLATASSFREECLRKGAELAQAMSDALFALLANKEHDGPIVRLPPPP